MPRVKKFLSASESLAYNAPQFGSAPSLFRRQPLHLRDFAVDDAMSASRHELSRGRERMIALAASTAGYISCRARLYRDFIDFKDSIVVNYA